MDTSSKSETLVPAPDLSDRELNYLKSSSRSLRLKAQSVKAQALTLQQNEWISFLGEMGGDFNDNEEQLKRWGAETVYLTEEEKVEWNRAYNSLLNPKFPTSTEEFDRIVNDNLPAHLYSRDLDCTEIHLETDQRLNPHSSSFIGRDEADKFVRSYLIQKATASRISSRGDVVKCELLDGEMLPPEDLYENMTQLALVEGSFLSVLKVFSADPDGREPSRFGTRNIAELAIIRYMHGIAKASVTLHGRQHNVVLGVDEPQKNLLLAVLAIRCLSSDMYFGSSTGSGLFQPVEHPHRNIFNERAIIKALSHDYNFNGSEIFRDDSRKSCGFTFVELMLSNIGSGSAPSHLLQNVLTVLQTISNEELVALQPLQSLITELYDELEISGLYQGVRVTAKGVAQALLTFDNKEFPRTELRSVHPEGPLVWQICRYLLTRLSNEGLEALRLNHLKLFINHKTISGPVSLGTPSGSRQQVLISASAPLMKEVTPRGALPGL